jgi:undecaprenyl diphosphate synthase
MSLPNTLDNPQQTKLHVAVIMDGNGRWAAKRGRPRSAGHVMGARTVRAIVEACVNEGIGILTLYAFSSDNWKRPSREVSFLMRLFRRYLLSEVDRCVQNGVRVRVIGRRDRLPVELRKAIEAAELATQGGTNLDLRIAVDYSARESIMMAAQRLIEQNHGETGAVFNPLGATAREQFAQVMNDVTNAGPARDVDLLIRTGGEQRLSDFLLWECAYAELYFTNRMWPEFSVADLQAALRDFHSRERRFGGVQEHDQTAVAAAG